MPEATFAGHVVLPDGSQRPVHFSRQGNQTLGLFKDTQLPGDYSIVVSASDGATALGETRARFIVYDLDLEMENSAPRPALMESLAQTTHAAGGERISPEELPQLVRAAEETAARVGSAGRNERNAVGQALFLAAGRRPAFDRMVLPQKMGLGLTTALWPFSSIRGQVTC